MKRLSEEDIFTIRWTIVMRLNGIVHTLLDHLLDYNFATGEFHTQAIIDLVTSIVSCDEIVASSTPCKDREEEVDALNKLNQRRIMLSKRIDRYYREDENISESMYERLNAHCKLLNDYISAFGYERDEDGTIVETKQ